MAAACGFARFFNHQSSIINPNDTIVAVASAASGGARGIVRLSGPDVRACIGRVFRGDVDVDLPALAGPTVVAGSLHLGGTHSPLPCELYLWPPGRSYTREPVAEIHTFGSPPLLEIVVRALCAAGGRLAEPGEFTLRAFLAGRIDLTQAEAVLGVIDAADPRQLDVALAQLAGGLARPLDRLRNALLDLLSHLEAGFDFPDEDLPFLTPEVLRRQLAAAARGIADLLGQIRSRGETTEVARAVLVGRPNTGKSSLFNALSKEALSKKALSKKAGALVSHHGGTTRDYLRADLDLDGVMCQLIDTAGLGPSPEGPDAEVERAAQEASLRQSEHATVRILCLDATRPPDDWERARLAQDAGAGWIRVLTKVDAAGAIDFAPDALQTSSVTGVGIDALRTRLRETVLAAETSASGVVAGTAVRCRESLRQAADSLERARHVADANAGEELVAAEVRTALGELGKVVGTVYTEDVLDRVFSRFCIGK
jgi:tRNA modification GTPase